MTTGFEFFPVTFRIFSNYTGGKNKGKPNPETFHTLTLMRLVDYNNPSNTESVGQTLKRAKTMIDQTHTKIVLTNPGKEADFERDARYAREGLEVVKGTEVTKATEEASIPITLTPEVTSDRIESGDETFVINVQESEAA